MAHARIFQLRIERPSCRRQTTDRRIASILDAHAAQGYVVLPGEANDGTLVQFCVVTPSDVLMTLDVKPKQQPLLGSQCLNWIYASGAVGWEETSKKRRTREHQSCGKECQRIARAYVIQDFGQDAPCSQRKKKAGTNCKSRLHRALSHAQSQHIAPMCSPGHPAP